MRANLIRDVAMTASPVAMAIHSATSLPAVLAPHPEAWPNRRGAPDIDARALAVSCRENPASSASTRIPQR